MKGKLFSPFWRVAIALVMVLSFGLMAAPVSATHTSSATIAFATGESNVTEVSSVLDVEVTNDAASADGITAVTIDFTDSDFTVTDEGTPPDGWTSGDPVAKVVTYTKDSGDLAPGASVTFSPVVTNPAEAGDAVVPEVLTTDAGTQASLDAALDTGWIGYVADSVGVGGNDITVAYVDPGFPSQSLSVSVDVKAITVSLETDGGGALVSTASEVAAAITAFGAADALVDAAADGGHLDYDVLALTVPAFTGGTSPDTDKDCTVTPGTLTVIGPKPTVDGIYPKSGNAGETMWVEVTGTDFVEDNTSFDFGTTEVSVVAGSYHYVSPTEVDCQITISKAGAARYVIPTTSREGTNTTAQFDPNAAGSAQVDVWDKYTPVVDIAADGWDDETLEMTDDTVYTTIGAAITAADASDILIAHPATYSPTAQVLVNEAVTIRSLTGLKTGDGSAEDTIIDCTAVDIATGAINIGIDGVVIQGLTIMDTTTTFGSKSMGLIASNGNDVTVKNCVITGAEWIAIGLGGTLTATTIQDNTISNSLGWAIVAIEPFDVSAAGALDIKGNTITGCGSGLLQYLPDLYEVIGIRATADGKDMSGVSIENNVIADNDAVGLIVENFSAGNSPVIRYNDIHNNGTWGLYCPDTDGVDAKYNYWGEIGGPSAGTGADASTALGSGEPVSTYVTFDPWLTETQDWTVEKGIAYFGSTMPLQEGWNTLSVPLKLKDSANTIEDIVALGDFLTATNWEIAYQYNPELTPEAGGWENIGTSPIDLVPLRGYYIKTLEAVTFPVLYYGDLGLPALDLDAGWNLIGSGFGIDKVAGGATDISFGDYGICSLDPHPDAGHTYGDTEITSGDADDESWKDLDTALSSILTNCSVVVSPTMPGQEAAWAVTGGTYNFMIVGEGYWVFMTDSATLAGFEITPIYHLP